MVRIGTDGEHLDLERIGVGRPTLRVGVAASGIRASLLVEPSYSGEGFGDLVAFIDDLEDNWRGWAGERSWQSLEGELAFRATHTGSHVALRVELNQQFGAGAPWVARVDLTLEAGEELAAAASAVRDELDPGVTADDIAAYWRMVRIRTRAEYKELQHTSTEETWNHVLGRLTGGGSAGRALFVRVLDQASGPDERASELEQHFRSLGAPGTDPRFEAWLAGLGQADDGFQAVLQFRERYFADESEPEPASRTSPRMPRKPSRRLGRGGRRG